MSGAEQMALVERDPFGREVVGVSDVVRVLKRVRVRPGCPESELQDAIAAALGRVCVYRREVRLAPRCRIDFVVAGVIGVEVKVGKPSRRAVEAQLVRYAETKKLGAVVLVMDRVILSLDDDALGIPYRFVSLNMERGIAL